MKKLTKQQIKIIIASAVGVFCLLLFWVVFYLPYSNSVKKVKKELLVVSAEIKEIQGLAEGRDFTQVVKDFNINLNKLRKYLPAQDDTVVQALAGKARELRIDVGSLTLSSKRLLEDKIAGFSVEEVPIDMELTCNFITLGKYLAALSDNFPVLIKINALSVISKGEGRTKLKINLNVSGFLAKEM